MILKKITKDQINELPLGQFEGEIILVDSKEQIEEAARQLSKQKLLGFDTETRPSFRKGTQYTVSLLQLATENVAYLFRLNEIGLPTKIQEIMEDNHVVKIGAAVLDDLRALRKLSLGFQPHNFFDLNESLLEALFPILFLIVLLVINIIIFGTDGLSGSNQLVLVIASAIAGLVAIFRLHISWEDLQSGIVKSISSAMSSILILLLIGSLAGTWLLSGIVPAMIYYGLQILNPTIFLIAACIVSAVVSVATGSSWTTVATVGVALLGIGRALGFEEGLIAGAILSGAYFGDKMSPLSDTTNLAPAMAGTDLFTHIRHMTKTTIPSITITLIIFGIIGFTSGAEGSVVQVKEISEVISVNFNINGWLFIVPLLVIAMIVKKVPAVPALLAGALLGGLFAIIFQPQIIALIAGPDGDYVYQSYRAVMMALYGTISITTSNEVVNELLATGGMAGMLNTIWLIVCAMVFGGIMEESGMLRVLAEAVISKVHSLGSLIASTAATCVFFNVTTSDQYLAILVPGRMYADIYKKRGLKPENLSRTLEDSATVTSVLVPWNTCGATQASVLGVATLVYAPYCFFNIISPLMTILFGYLKLGINYYSEEEMVEIRKELAV